MEVYTPPQSKYMALCNDEAITISAGDNLMMDLLLTDRLDEDCHELFPITVIATMDNRKMLSAELRDL